MKLKVSDKLYELGNDVHGLMCETKYMQTSAGKGNRNCEEIVLPNSTITQAKAIGMQDNILWSLIDVVDGEEVEYDHSEWNLLGDIVEHTNNSVSIYMCKYTNEELLNKTIDDLLEA